MAVMFNRVPLAVVFGLAVGPIAFADTVERTQAGWSATSDRLVSFHPFSGSARVVPPLRLALALPRERQHVAAQPEHDAQVSMSQSASSAAIHSLSAPARETGVASSGPLPVQAPPLRLALALNGKKVPSELKPGDAAREASIRLAQQARTDTQEQQKTETPSGSPGLIWEIVPNDRTLNSTLSRWAANAGWQLVWDMEVDYPIETRAVLQGTFQEAVATVAQSLAGASVPVQATFYEGNKVLRIIAKGSK